MSVGAGTSESTLASLKAELASFRKVYEKLQDFLIGADYDISDVKASLHVLKERMSYINLLIGLRAIEMGNISELAPLLRAFTSTMDEFKTSVDVTPVMIELLPRENP